MRKYLLERFMYVLLVMLSISIILFMLLHLAPGDPVRLILGDSATDAQLDIMRVKLGYDKPILLQYFNWFKGLLSGNWGNSLFYNRPVFDLIKPALINTIILSGAAFLVSMVIAIPLGVMAGVKRGSISDVGVMGFAMLGQSISPTWLGIILVLIFSVRLGWFPAYGNGSFIQLVLPAITLGTPTAAFTSRMIRAGMIDAMEEDFITVARAKGESEAKVIFKYALKNVMIPVITIIGLQIGFFLSGSVVTETIFAWNGIGRLMVDSVNRRDYPLVMGCLLLSSILFVLINFIVDILYMVVDPRIRSTLIAENKRKTHLGKTINGTTEKGAI